MDVSSRRLPGEAGTGEAGDDRRFGWWLAVSLLVAAEVAKLWVIIAAGPVPVVSDAAGYWNLGRQAADGDVFLTANPIAYRTPGYPWLLGFFQSVAGREAWLTAVIVQGVALLATSALTYVLVRQLGGGRRLGLLAWSWSALSIARASFATVLLTETVFTGLLVGLVIELLVYVAKPSWRVALAIGCLWGLLCLIRPVGLTVTPAVIAALSLAERGNQYHLRRMARDMGLACGIAGMLIAPWCVRNAVLFGKPTPMDFLGRELWLSTYGAGSPAGPPLPDTPHVKALKEVIPAEQHARVDWKRNWSVSNALTAAGQTDAIADEMMLRASLEGVSRAPHRFVARFLVRQIDFWRAVYSPEQALYRQPEFAEAGPPAGQSRWGLESAAPLREQFLELAPARRLLVVEVTSLLALLGLIGLLLPSANRAGIVLMISVASLAIPTAALELPDFRYRMVLEPLLIAATLVGCRTWGRVVRLGMESLRSNRGEASGRTSV